MTNYLFVLGTGRCGSTLVHEILARHPDLGFISNLDDRIGWAGRRRGPYNNQIYRLVPGALTRKGRARFAPSEGYRILDREVSPILSMPFRDLTADDATPWMSVRVAKFFDSFAKAQGRPVFSHKFTGWPRARFLAAIFPAAKFVNVVRDGRAVANSWLQMPWWLGYRGPHLWHFGELPPSLDAEWRSAGQAHEVLAGLAWRMLMEQYEVCREHFGSDRWMDVRYEDFLEQPRDTLAAILEFSGVQWKRSFERGVARHPLSPKRRDAFNDDLSPAQLKRLEAAISPTLRTWGYRV